MNAHSELLTRIADLEDQVERLSRRIFPEDFRKPEPAPPDPTVDLLGEPESSSDRYLEQRFDALTDARCWLDADERRAMHEEYMEHIGLYLPRYYVHPDTDEIIDRETGAVVTEERRLLKKINGVQHELRRCKANHIEYAIPELEEELRELRVQLSKAQGKPAPKNRDLIEDLANRTPVETYAS